MAGLFIGTVLTAASATVALSEPQGWDLFGWRPDGILSRVGMVLASLSVLLLLIGFCWLVSGLSAAFWVRLTLTRTVVDDLRRSRKVLNDAFSGERRGIERELHDGVQQYLTAVQPGLATAQIKADGDPDVVSAISLAQQNTKRAVEALRTTIRGIHPQVLWTKWV